MNRTLTIVLSLVAGVAGGLFSRWMAPEIAHAQTSAPKEIRAQSFVLVNEKGQPYGLMGFGPDGRPVIKLIGENGQTIWSSNGVVLRPPSR